MTDGNDERREAAEAPQGDPRGDSPADPPAESAATGGLPPAVWVGGLIVAVLLLLAVFGVG